ncbi:hypothetical protein FSP39_015985 [Pinctada imbricata]|uniref:VWFA domain-containing protein n=1 Tax=Pinctada imbricata TaxID=66713 RepID=A0AA89C5I3_PINIB|nr:hypothetical protein FSP39_015985 [Pinctada imbricata]
MIVCTVYNVWKIQCKDIAWQNSDSMAVRMDEDPPSVNCTVRIDFFLKECKEKSDIVFAVDDSSSVFITSFKKVKSFIKRVLLPANIDSGDVRVGLLRFSDDVSVEFDLNTYTSKKELFRHVDSMQRAFGNTYTAEALRVMNEEMFNQSKGDRDNVQNIAIVVTDGRSIFLQETLARAKQARQNGVHIFVIGVGDVSEDEIRGMASLPSMENAFTLEGYAQLRRFKEDFFRFCKGKNYLQFYFIFVCR